MISNLSIHLSIAAELYTCLRMPVCVYIVYVFYISKYNLPQGYKSEEPTEDHAL